MMWPADKSKNFDTKGFSGRNHQSKLSMSCGCAVGSLSNVTYWLIISLFVLLGHLFTGVAFAQTERAEETDPIDILCSTIGAPVAAQDIDAFSNHVVRGVSTTYTEVLGILKNERMRSVRYLPDESRTAQYVYVDGRQICLTAPGSDSVTCGVPLECSSGEADYVMVNDNDAPFAMIDKPKITDPEAPPLAEDHDWVTYAGGTVQLTIGDEQIEQRKTASALNISERGQCAVGAGHPVLDDAFAYYWQGPGCNGANASGKGKAIYLDKNGTVGAITFGPDVGIRTENGQLFWSFTDQPVALTIECSNDGDTKIPTSKDEVVNIKAEMVVPFSVETGEPLVYGKLVSEANDYIEKICGTPPLPKQTEYLISRAINGETLDLDLVWTDKGETVVNQNGPAFRYVESKNVRAQESGIVRFASYIRKSVENDRWTSVMENLKSSGQLTNVANGMRAGDVQTLVALTSGVTTRMPWAWSGPTYSDGQFRLSWNISSTDPATEFFRNRSQPGWALILAKLPSGPDQVSLRLTCILSQDEARSLPANRAVEVEATLISRNSSDLVFRCEAP